MFSPNSDIGYNVSAFDMLHILKIYIYVLLRKEMSTPHDIADKLW